MRKTKLLHTQYNNGNFDDKWLRTGFYATLIKPNTKHCCFMANISIVIIISSKENANFRFAFGAAKIHGVRKKAVDA